MRCGQRIVNEGDDAAVLLAACGSPALRDQWFKTIPGTNRTLADTELWTYDFGPNLLLRLVKLHDGRIFEIESDGYGFPKGVALRCQPRDLLEGMSKYRVFRRCGEPLTRRDENSLRPLPSHPNAYRDQSDGWNRQRNSYVIPVYREEWVYNFGAQSPMRRIVFEDGWITHVETLDRGFDPR